MLSIRSEISLHFLTFKERTVFLWVSHTAIQSKLKSLFTSFLKKIRNYLALLVWDADFFSVYRASCTDKATIDEEMVQFRLLKNNSRIYRFVAVTVIRMLWAMLSVDEEVFLKLLKILIAASQESVSTQQSVSTQLHKQWVLSLLLVGCVSCLL